MYYSINDLGYIISQGISVEFGDLIANGDEPFLNANEGDLWRYVEGEWINEKADYKYFLIPSDMVPAISHYAGFVKEALTHLSFNVLCGYSTAIVEGEDVQTPLYINQIPCICTHWTDDGLQLLDAVVENWNTSNPLKQMVEPYKFESYNELIAFRDGQI